VIGASMQHDGSRQRPSHPTGRALLLMGALLLLIVALAYLSASS
jgi:hypothetical protein